MAGGKTLAGAWFSTNENENVENMVDRGGKSQYNAICINMWPRAALDREARRQRAGTGRALPDSGPRRGNGVLHISVSVGKALDHAGYRTE